MDPIFKMHAPPMQHKAKPYAAVYWLCAARSFLDEVRRS